MKLVRWGPARAERWGVLDSAGEIRALPPSVTPGTREALTLDHIDRLADGDAAAWPAAPSGVRLGPPVSGCGKIVCIGLNYRDHAREAGMQVPPEPVVFMKATSALCGPNDEIRMPRGGTKLDWEVELAVVIGREGRDIPEREARSFVAGYCILNDVSERAFQLEGTGQWVKGKSADTFAPLGPWLVTPDEVADPQDLAIWLKVNGQPRQQSTTRNMIFGVDALVSYVSRFMSLHPGDVIATGTPPGVGLGMNPPQYLAPGDVVELGIGGLGHQRQTVVGAGA
jgi:2-keto-4-pentenoate hydratase/2-oxohepta-3-ene-1,7-dioic acid hydratase in catechol pathway